MFSLTKNVEPIKTVGIGQTAVRECEFAMILHLVYLVY